MSNELVPSDPNGTSTEPYHRPFTWTKQRRKAASLTANGVSIQDCARECKVSYGAIMNWRSKLEFWEYVRKIQKELEAQAVGFEIASRLKRVEALNQLKKDAITVKIERAMSAMTDPNMHMNQTLSEPLVPGAATGMLTHRVKFQSTGDGTMNEVHEYEFDHGLVKTILSLDNQAIQELGQKADQKIVHEGNPDAPIKFTLAIDKPIEGIVEQRNKRDFVEGEFHDV